MYLLDLPSKTLQPALFDRRQERPTNLGERRGRILKINGETRGPNLLPLSHPPLLKRGCCEISGSPEGGERVRLLRFGPPMAGHFLPEDPPLLLPERMLPISSLLPLLEKYWPTLSCGSTHQCFGGKGLFWAHEWGKHGTCSYPVIHDEYSYFSKALELYFKYNITDILSSAGFLASNVEKYPVGDIVSIVKKAVGATPEVVCKKGSVQELQICFNKDFKPRDCLLHSVIEDETSNSRSSCPRYVSLPTYAPLVLGDVSAADAAVRRILV